MGENNSPNFYEILTNKCLQNYKNVIWYTKEVKDMNKVYASIDLKSFFASVECQERGLDPLTTNLVVADPSRTEKTICLAVTPSLKAYGIAGRARLFEVVQKIKEVNAIRKSKLHQTEFSGKSYLDSELKANPNLAVDYVVAPPRMGAYMKYSTRIYQIYLKYLSPEDIFPYSIDEVFCDLTHYLETYHMTAKELITTMIRDVYQSTGITATAGIGTNLFLCKIAMDIVAKHTKPDQDGVRIAQLDEMSFRQKLWNHRPITDFWRVGKGYAKKLEQYGMYTMGDVARCSLEDEDLLYRLFGVNAELLIDHSWGWESATVQSVKACIPKTKSLSSGQVLHCPYDTEKAKLIVKEMADLLVLDMVEKHYATDMLVLHIDYDIKNLSQVDRKKLVKGTIKEDRYGRLVPKPAHGTFRFTEKIFSSKKIRNGFMTLYDQIIQEGLLIRKVNLTVGNLSKEEKAPEKTFEQVNLFTDYKEQERREKQETKQRNKEKEIQKAILQIKHKYGKNAIIKAMNLEEGATTIERNRQIGGHKE